MNPAIEVLTEARAAGVRVRLSVDHKHLVLEAGECPPADLRARLRQYKPQIVALLSQTFDRRPSPARPEWWHDAAIVVQDLVAEGKPRTKVRRMFGFTWQELNALAREPMQ